MTLFRGALQSLHAVAGLVTVAMLVAAAAAHPRPQCRKIWRIVTDIAERQPVFHGCAVGPPCL